LFDPAQDRLSALQVITPGHPLIPPRDPEVGQRASKVTARSSAGAHATRRRPPGVVRRTCCEPFTRREAYSRPPSLQKIAPLREVGHELPDVARRVYDVVTVAETRIT